MGKKPLKRLEEIEAQSAAMREALETFLMAYDSSWPGACQQECFDTSDGHGYEMQDIAKDEARKALQSDAGHDLLDRLHKLERVAEAARRLREPLVRDFTGAYSRADEMLDTTDMDVCVWCEHPVDLYRDYNHAADCPWKKLQEALAALEEGRG